MRDGLRAEGSGAEDDWFAGLVEVCGEVFIEVGGIDRGGEGAFVADLASWWWG